MMSLLQGRVFALAATVIAALIAGVAAFSLLRPGHGPISSGVALVGGPFELVSHKGQPVTDKDFRGKYMLVSFGYTYCPDVCPTELQVISAALDELGDKARDIQPIFITIDPERDTVAALAQYMQSFHPSYIGLTGSPEAIAKAAKAYRVYYAKSDPNRRVSCRRRLNGTRALLRITALGGRSVSGCTPEPPRLPLYTRTLCES